MEAKERPILFSAPMVRALLAGTKTQTRRVVKPQPRADTMRFLTGLEQDFLTHWPVNGGDYTGSGIACPYGQPGDRLWVRETWSSVTQGFDTAEESTFAVYRADVDRTEPKRWIPSIHMPRWASRITLEVTDVRVQRLHECPEADAIAEGIHRIDIGDGYDPKYSASPRSWSEAIEQHPDVQDTARGAYRELWESINGLGSWLANPWVWAVSFKRVTP